MDADEHEQAPVVHEVAGHVDDDQEDEEHDDHDTHDAARRQPAISHRRHLRRRRWRDTEINARQAFFQAK